MKITVEMTLEDFAEFLRFREGKGMSDKLYNEMRVKAYRFRETVLNAIMLDEKSQTAGITYNDALRVYMCADAL